MPSRSFMHLKFLILGTFYQSVTKSIIDGRMDGPMDGQKCLYPALQILKEKKLNYMISPLKLKVFLFIIFGS